MEHPFKTILKALAIVLVSGILISGLPLVVRSFSSEEWYLAIAAVALLAAAALVQLYNNAGKLLLRRKAGTK